METVAATPSIVFTWEAYVRSSISLLGVITNLVNIAVFLSPKLRETSYNFMLAKSLSNLVYLVISFVSEFFVFCPVCPYTGTLGSAYYMYIVYIYIYGSLSIYRAFIEIMVSVHTFCILTNKNWTKKIPSSLTILILAALALAYNIPKLFAYTVIEISTLRMFFISSTSFGKSSTNQAISIALTFIKIVLTSVALPLVNIVNLVLFRRRFKIGNISTMITSTAPQTITKSVNSLETTRVRKSIRSERQTVLRKTQSTDINKNIAKMVLTSSLISILGQMPFSTFYITGVAAGDLAWLAQAKSYAAFFIVLSPSLDFFCYFFFNKMFKKALIGYFSAIKSQFVKSSELFN